MPAVGLPAANLPSAQPASGIDVPAIFGKTVADAAPRTRLLPRLPQFRGIMQAAATELDRGIAFVLAPVFMAAGALVYFAAGHEPSAAPLAISAACLGLLVMASRSHPPVNLALAALLLAVVGALAGKAETWRADTRMLGAEVTTQLTGRLVAIEHMAKGRDRLTVSVTRTERPVLRYAPDQVRVSARTVGDDIVPGTEITGLVRLMPPTGPVRPGSYDFSFRSYFDGNGASGFFLRGPVLTANPAAAGLAARMRAMVQGWRAAAAAHIAERIGGAEGEIAAALVVGVRAGIPDDVNEALRRAGIYHIISISGLHMALVAGTIMGLLRGAFALFPGFSSRRPVKKYAAAVAVAGIAAYLFISGAEVAAQRSFIMLAVMLTAVLFDRAALTMRNLAISAIVVIAVSPHEVAGPSFQMSFAATAALVGAYAAWADYRLRRPARTQTDRPLILRGLGRATGAIAGLAMTSLVAGGATAIYAAYHFQQMPSLGLFTNLAAMPIVSTLVMPFAVLGTLAMPFGLDGPFFDVMGMGLSATVAIARWFSERSPIDVVGPVSGLSVTLLTAALVIATVCTTWLRAAAVPLLLAGLLTLPGQAPDLLVSEDGRLVGLDAGDAGMAVNRTRPNAFTTGDWQRAMLAGAIVGPVVAKNAPASVAGLVEQLAGQPNGTQGFVCSERACAARHASGAIIVHAKDPAGASEACGLARVVVIDDATALDPCRSSDVLVVGRRDLAQRGSAAVTFGSRADSNEASNSEAATGENFAPTVEIEFAIERPYRPWHAQRRYSREARGLAPYSRTRPAAAEGASADSRNDPDQ
ncbi:MAG: ComEC/Rec2 family competence protein [Alphaproteobacteria bacterium]|nr:ComEC/Rec2 family competence protein [Alphaproteobacteria bacterium]MBU0802788.1 ComEC/Rec2 family competence protein [Alphaproteobacteria bacterium]MBU0871585.1 ComEC/Rec2 family competence protein [Alphaproteobacteria bacterium]MBU1400252.1 ComEC/Rec2 family competence protein [Alphaproteobacteria bacterium]MBU1591372.1 ComEC/Rec2 family competence protein [Alphaproteobacteria bacterium]